MSTSADAFVDQNCEHDQVGSTSSDPALDRRFHVNESRKRKSGFTNFKACGHRSDVESPIPPKLAKLPGTNYIKHLGFNSRLHYRKFLFQYFCLYLSYHMVKIYGALS